jgi:hypothetical protein
MSSDPLTSPPTRTPRSELFPPSVAPTKKIRHPTETEPTMELLQEQQARIGSLEAQILSLRDLMADLPAQIAAQLKLGNTTKTDNPLRQAATATSDHRSDSDSDSAPSVDSDSAPTPDSDRISAEILSLYLLQIMEPAQHSTSGSRHTTTASSLEAWLHKVNPGAREALFATVNSPGPIAFRGLSAFRTELRATTAPAKATVAAVTIAALTREQDHERALHTESLIGIACGCAHMKDLKEIIKTVRATGRYDMDCIPVGAASTTPSYHRFSPSYKRAATWWEALLDLFDAFWGSSAHYNEDDLQAEINWKAAALQGEPMGTFKQGTDSATALVAREALNYRSREITSQGRPFATPSDRSRNLLAAANPDLVEAFLDHLQAEKLALHSLTWGRLTGELIETEKALRDRKKTEHLLSYREAAAVTPSNRHHAGAHQTADKTKPADTDDRPDGTSDCWNWQYTGQCAFGNSCRHAHQGQAGSMKHYLATEDDVCKRYLQGHCDRGDQCKFQHPEPTGPPTVVKTKIFAIQNKTCGSWHTVGSNDRNKRAFPIRIVHHAHPLIVHLGTVV